MFFIDRIFNDVEEKVFLDFDVRDAMLELLAFDNEADMYINIFTATMKAFAGMLFNMVYSLFLGIIMIVYLSAPFACVVLSLWRIAQRNYGDMDGPDKIAANMTPALDIFYSLILCQCAMFLLWCYMAHRGEVMSIEFHGRDPLSEKWGVVSIREYISKTRGKCWQNPASIRGRNLINYAVGLLGSESPEEYLSGARLLGAFVKKREDVRSVLLPSRPKIQKLIDTLRWRSSTEENREIRELAATIVADLADDIDLAQYPGAIRCISSLLQKESNQTTFWNSNHQAPHPSPQKLVWPLTIEERNRQTINEKYQQEKITRQEQRRQGWMKKEERYRQKRLEMEEFYRQPRMEKEDRFPLRVIKLREFHEQRRMKNQQNVHDVQQQEQVGGSLEHDREQGTCNGLMLLGLTILERLASDYHNCRDICSTPGLIPKIMAPIYSKYLIPDIYGSSKWADVVAGSFKVVHRLISAPGKASRKLRLQISSNKQAVTNLEMILDRVNGASQELQIQAMKILTELALDSSIMLPENTTENFIRKQLDVFLSAEGEQVTATISEQHRATAGRTLVLLSTDSKTNSNLIMKASDSIAPPTGLPDDKNTVAHLTSIIIEDNKNNSTHLTEITVDKNTTASHLIEVTEDNNNVAHLCELTEKNKYTIIRLTELLGADYDIIYRTIAAQILDNLCTHCDWNKHKQMVKGSLLPKVLQEILSIKSDQPEHKNAEEKENKKQDKQSQGTSCASPSGDMSSDKKNEETATKELQESLLSLALVICGKMIRAGDDIEHALGGDAFVAKLKAIIDDNCQPTANSLRIVKLCGRIAESMMQSQPAYAEHFIKNEFPQSLSKASNIMSSLESCMIFVGTDFGLKNTIRPHLSQLKKVSDLQKK